MDIIMVLASVLFFVLFAFLLFVFVVTVLSVLIKRTFDEFTPAVSVVIPCYNEEQVIAGCIEAVLRNDYPVIEIIVVDDGSSDMTARIAQRYPVSVVKGKHLGKSAALNAGVKRANHDFVLALDADTEIEQDCIRELVKPLQDSRIGATTGVSMVRNRKSLLGMFQNIEYHYNNLIRNSFSRVFNNGIWFFGALACYRKSVLEQVGYFKADTLTEDMDIALEIKLAGYRTYNVKDARGSTVVPETWGAFYRQRSRWWMGVLQSLVKNRALLKKDASPSIVFLFVNQFWWSFYAVLSLPLIIYQVNYWLPYNTQSSSALAGYLFRWFSLSGPFYVLYKIPAWGFSLYSAFGVLAGLLSAILIVASVYLFKDRLYPKNIAALFFYFPYTIALNMVIFISLAKFKSRKTKFFLK